MYLERDQGLNQVAVVEPLVTLVVRGLRVLAVWLSLCTCTTPRGVAPNGCGMTRPWRLGRVLRMLVL